MTPMYSGDEGTSGVRMQRRKRKRKERKGGEANLREKEHTPKTSLQSF
jgi:hypothetical protein